MLQKKGAFALKKQWMAIVIGAAASLVLSMPVMAAEITTGDGVIGITTPDDTWQEIQDADTWVTLANGSDVIRIQHYANGEQLPVMTVASASNPKTYQAVISDEQEVFVITGLAADAESYDAVCEAVQSVEIKKEGTKTAVGTQEKTAADEFSIEKVEEEFWVECQVLNVRPTYSISGEVLGNLEQGEKVQVTGIVKKGTQDYGWRQISYQDGIAYVAAPWLTDEEPEGQAAEEIPEDAEKTGYQVELKNKSGKTVVAELYSDGVYRDEDEVVYTNEGDGAWTDSKGNSYTKQAAGSDVQEEDSKTTTQNNKKTTTKDSTNSDAKEEDKSTSE